MTYAQLDSLLVGRNKDKKKLAPNTYAMRGPKSIAIRLHATDILTFYPCGSVVVKTGGWKTVTTKSRINDYLPVGWHIFQEYGVWRWWKRMVAPEDTGQKFSDGDCITGRGELLKANV